MLEKKHPTIYDVAKKVGFSLATVSRVINKNGKVKNSTREKVLKAIKKLNYHPNAMAKGLASSKTTMIGMIVPNLTNSYYAELAQGIDAVAKIYNYSLSLAISGDSPETEKEAFATLSSKQVDGIIFMGGNVSKEIFSLMTKSSIPVVFAGTIDSKNFFPSVNIDYFGAFKELASKLKKDVSQSKTALIKNSNNLELSPVFERDFKQVIPKGKVYEVEDNYKKSYNLAPKLIKDNIHAIIVAEDITAIGILNYLCDHGLKIPKDFQIISVNDTELVNISRPPISSVAFPKFDIGAVSMRLLTKIMSGQKIDQKEVILPHNFVSRNTTL